MQDIQKNLNHDQSSYEKTKLFWFQYEKVMDGLQTLWIFRFLYAGCEAVSRCEVASILVAGRETRGLHQTVWRC